jgi:signal transduction histidine kinase
VLYEVTTYLCLLLIVIGVFFIILELKKRNAAYRSLREAYKDLETTKPLRELGQSSAFINHEIKNYMMIISGYATLLMKSKDLCERDRNMADNIAQTTAKLQEFSLSVLELSKSKTPRGNSEVDLARLLRDCIDAYFPKKSAKFATGGAAPAEGFFVDGNPEKLERVFINAFRNSFEAGANGIAVRFHACNAVALIVIEDDGAGCDAERLSNLSATFFTTKRGVRGAGLGLCVIRSIIEAHGGNINIYSKNTLGGGKHGIVTQITLPASKRTPYEAVKHEFLLIKHGLSDAAGVLKVLKNLKIIPHIANKPKDADLSPRSSSPGLTALASAEIAAELNGTADGGTGIKILPVEIGDDATAFIDAGNGREMFTEEFVIDYLKKN